MPKRVSGMQPIGVDEQQVFGSFSVAATARR